MTSNKGQPFNDQNEYEATVLDFLDKEMANVQLAEKKDPQSDELNALVTDMLKQVITEAEQPQSLNELVYDKEDDLFAGLTPNLTIDPIDRPTSLPAATPTKPTVPDNVVVSQNAPVQSRTAPSFPAPLLSLGSPSKGRKQLVMAAVAVCVAVIIGTAGYFFFRSPGKTSAIPKSQTAAKQLVSPPTKAVSAPNIQPSAKDSAVSAVGPKPNPVPAAPVSKQPANSGQNSVQQSGKPSSPPKEKTEAASAKPANTPAPVKEEKTAVTPPPTQEQPIPVAAAVEKPAVAAVPESPPAVPGKQPVPTLPTPPVSAAQPPTESRNLVAAVPISQVSPAYPELALRTRASGSVVLELQIDERGKVNKATAVSGPAIFYNAAVAAAMKWRYKPASIGGVNTRSVGKVTMDFNLKK